MTFGIPTKEPEKFATFLKHKKMIFIVVFLGYVCAYLVCNNFKLMSKSIMVTNGWEKADFLVRNSVFLLSSNAFVRNLHRIILTLL